MSSTSSDFKRVWFITGAARGIGARIAEAALAQGDAVVATSRDATSLQQRFGAQPGLLALALDVTSEAQAAAAAEAAGCAGDHPDALEFVRCSHVGSFEIRLMKGCGEGNVGFASASE